MSSLGRKAKRNACKVPVVENNELPPRDGYLRFSVTDEDNFGAAVYIPIGELADALEHVGRVPTGHGKTWAEAATSLEEWKWLKAAALYLLQWDIR